MLVSSDFAKNRFLEILYRNDIFSFKLKTLVTHRVQKKTKNHILNRKKMCLGFQNSHSIIIKEKKNVKLE